MNGKPGAAAQAALLLEVQHDTHYRYAAPVSLAHHLAHLQPLQDEHQTLLAFNLDIDPKPDGQTRASSQQASASAPVQRFFSLAQPHRHLRVRASSHLRVTPRFHGLQAQHAPAWDELAAGLRYGAALPYQSAGQYTAPSPYVPRLPALRDYAAPSFAAGLPVVQGALALMQRMHADFTYEPASTDIHTPLAIE